MRKPRCVLLTLATRYAPSERRRLDDAIDDRGDRDRSQPPACLLVASHRRRPSDPSFSGSSGTDSTPAAWSSNEGGKQELVRARVYRRTRYEGSSTELRPRGCGSALRVAARREGAPRALVATRGVGPRPVSDATVRPTAGKPRRRAAPWMLPTLSKERAHGYGSAMLIRKT